MTCQPPILPVQYPEHAPLFIPVARDWSGAEEESRPAFRIVRSANSLEFLATARKRPDSAPGSRPGGFHEGLWQHDCAELFLGNPVTGHYIEINLAPNGAWWTCLFEEPRVRALMENLPLEDVHAEGLEGVSHWEARIRIPLDSLPATIGRLPEPTIGNVCFSLGNAPKQRFLSFAAAAHGTPDFHRPDLWLPLAPGEAHHSSV